MRSKTFVSPRDGLAETACRDHLHFAADLLLGFLDHVLDEPDIAMHDARLDRHDRIGADESGRRDQLDKGQLRGIAGKRADRRTEPRCDGHAQNIRLVPDARECQGSAEVNDYGRASDLAPGGEGISHKVGADLVGAGYGQGQAGIHIGPEHDGAEPNSRSHIAHMGSVSDGTTELRTIPLMYDGATPRSRRMALKMVEYSSSVFLGTV